MARRRVPTSSWGIAPDIPMVACDILVPPDDVAAGSL